MSKHPRLLASIVLMSLVTFALSGCLVKKETPEPPKNRKSDKLRVYKNGDWIQYNVLATVITGSNPGEVLTGTLTISWDGPYQLTSPDNKQYDVLKKVITVNMDDNGTVVQKGTVHYVRQDADGAEQLVAMGHPNTGQYYWLNTAGGKSYPDNDDGIIGGQEAVTIFDSPLFVGQQYQVEYTLMDDCIVGQLTGCQSNVGTSTNNLSVVGDSTQINTNIGNYANPFEVSFSGGIVPSPDVNNLLPVLFSIFDVCSDAQSTHIGRMFVVPEIGILQLSNRCTDVGATGDLVQYDLTIDSISSSISSGS